MCSHNHQSHDRHHCHCSNTGSSCCSPSEKESVWLEYRREIFSFIMMLAGIILTHFGFFTNNAETLLFYLISLFPVGLPIAKETIAMWGRRDFFNEFTLMLLATAGAFWLGDCPEGVAILLFYSFGEKLEDSASDRARSRISSLLGTLPEKVRIVKEDGEEMTVSPEDICPDDIYRVLPGERVAVDGVLESTIEVEFNTSAITGESLPVSKQKGEEILSGSLTINREALIRVTKPLSESTMTRITKMIEEAAANKSRSETLLRRITRYYTPAVMIAALLVFFIPMLYAAISGNTFNYHQWLYRALVLLVCSCPCALVVSIPLSYFAAIGNASRRGILFKGSRYLDTFRTIDTILIDKTGTITTGEFSIAGIKASGAYSEDDILSLAASVESGSSHPLAQAIVAEAEAKGLKYPKASDVVTLSHGLEAIIEGKKYLIGSAKLMNNHGIEVEVSEAGATAVIIATSGKTIGIIYLIDTIKQGVTDLFKQLHKEGVRNITILSGDREESVRNVAESVGADGFKAELLPEEKHKIVESFKLKGAKVAFIGDGINDAPSLAASDVGIAIGTGGTDVAMESADAVIVGDDLSPLSSAIPLSKKIKRIVAVNVSLAIGVKLLVMILGVFGIATLWAAVFADTGITLVTILFTLAAMRVGRK